MRRVLALFVIAICVLLSFQSASHSGPNPAPYNPPRIKVKDGTSTNWSGYAVETNLQSPLSNAVSDVKGSWTVPTVSCTSTNTWSSVWVGIDGYSSGTVEQTGTDSDCSSGQPVYYAWYEMYPKFPVNLSMAIRPGDVISAEVNATTRGQFILTLINTTTGASFSTTQKLPRAARSSAEWIVEAPSSSGGVLPLANFGTVTVTGAQATLNGHTGSISDSAWQADPITMVNSSGGVKAQTSALSSGGTSFSVTFKSSN